MSRFCIAQFLYIRFKKHYNQCHKWHFSKWGTLVSKRVAFWKQSASKFEMGQMTPY